MKKHQYSAKFFILFSTEEKKIIWGGNNDRIVILGWTTPLNPLFCKYIYIYIFFLQKIKEKELHNTTPADLNLWESISAYIVSTLLLKSRENTGPLVLQVNLPQSTSHTHKAFSCKINQKLLWGGNINQRAWVIYRWLNLTLASRKALSMCVWVYRYIFI